MKSATELKGYSYPIEMGRQARDRGEILTMRVETSLLCNLKCRYCAWDSGSPLEDEISYATLVRFIAEGKELGAKSVVVIGGGEPTVFKKFKELITLIHSLDMTPVIITNGLVVDRELAEFLYEKNCSILLKYDSYTEEIQEYLSGRKGTFASIENALHALMDVGFCEKQENETEQRMGLSFVVTKKNVQEVPNIWRFCRKNNLYPNMELLNPIGRTADNIEDLSADPKLVKEMLEEIKKIDDKEFGIEQKKCKEHANHCLQHLYSVYLNVQGYVQPCGAMRIKKFNFKDSTLKNILNNDYFKIARNLEKHLSEDVELTSFNV